MRRPSGHGVLSVVLGAALLLYFVDLGGSSIWDANEAFYVETPREMMERGDYVFPTFNYEPRLNKPILSYWIVAGLFSLFGVSVGVQRFGIAVAAVLIVAAGFLLARAAGRAPAGAALVAAAGLAVDPRLVMFGRRIFIDMWISAFMALVLACFAASERWPARRRPWLVLMYVCVGLGVLTKGPIAALLPGLVFAVYLTAHGELRRASAMMIPAGVAIVLAIVAPWYIALYLRDGWTHIVSFFVGENIGRYTSGIGQVTPRPVYFYLPVVFGDAFPLSLYLVPAAVLWWRTRERLLSLLWLWVLVTVVFFSFSHDKQDLYIFPIVPAVAALGAVAFVRRDEIPRSAWMTTLVMALVVAAIGAGVLWLFAGARRVYAVDGAHVMGMLALTGGAAAAALGFARRLLPALVVTLATCAAVNWVFVLRVLPDFERYKPVPKLSDYLRPRLADTDRIAHFNVALPSMVFYLRRHVEPYYDAAAFVAAMRSDARVYGILPERDYAIVQRELAGAACVLHRVPTYDVKLRNMLAREPLPHLVLITNRCG